MTYPRGSALASDKDKLKEFVESGWYADVPGSSYTGSPTTVEERDYIENFIERYGARPTGRQVSVGMGGNLGETYLPGGMHYEMGYRTGKDYLRAQEENLPYGPYTGKDVPFGGTVTTDAQGNPLRRYYDTRGTAKQDISQGRYLVPPTEAEGAMMPGVYPSNQFTPPTRGEALTKADPYRLYQSMFADYSGRKQEEYLQVERQYQDIDNQLANLTGRIGKDLTAEQATSEKKRLETEKSNLEKQISGMLSPEALISAKTQANMMLRSLQTDPNALLGMEDLPYYGQMYSDNLYNYLNEQVNGGRITKDDANLVIDEAEKLSKQGKKFTDLPLFEEVMGKYTQKYLEEVVSGTEQEAREKFAGRANYQPRPYTESTGPTGAEKQEYYTFMQQFPQSQQSWFAQNYSALYGFWINTRPDVPFMQWLPGYLAGMEETPVAEEITRPDLYSGARLAPRTRMLNY